MAQYGPFFAENYAVGTKLSAVTGFTPAHDAASNDDVEVMEDTVSGVTFRYWRPVGSSGNKPYTYDPAGDVHDMEMLCQMYIVSSHRDTILAVAQADMPDSDTYYRFGLRDRDAVVERFVTGSFTGIAAGDAYLLSGDTGKYMYMRCRRDSSNFRIRFFGLSDDYSALRGFPSSEPSTWELETTDTGITADGKVGLSWRADDGMGVLWVSFGTAGDEAPTPEGTLSGTVTIDDATPDSSTAVDVQWSYNETNATGFQARVDGGDIQDLGDPSPKEDRVTGLSPSTTYNSPGLELRAYNDAGETTEWSSPATFTTPAEETPTFARTNQTIMVQTQLAGETASSGSVRYLPMAASYETGSNITSSRKPITDSIKVSRPFIVVTANDRDSDSTVTLVDDDTATSVSITIPAGETGTFEDATNDYTFDGTTHGHWEVDVSSGTGGFTATKFGYVLEPTDEDKVLSWIGPLNSGEDSFGSASEAYRMPVGDRESTATEADAEMRMMFPGTLRDLRVAGGLDTYDGQATLGFREDSVDTALTVAFDSATVNTVGSTFYIENLVDNDAVAEGADFTLFSRPDGAASGATRDVKWNATLESDNSEDGNGDRTGEFLLAMGISGGVVPGSNSVYFPVAGEPDDVSTESGAQVELPLDCGLFRLVARAASTSTGTWVVTLRRNGVDTDLKLEVSGASTTVEAPIDLVEFFDAGDLVSYRVDVESGTPRIQYIGIAGAVKQGADHELTAQDIATSAPSIGSPSITQVHALTAQSVAAGTPTIEQPTVGSETTHDLTAQDIATPAPVVGSAAVGQVHSLASADVAVGSPVIVNATITQNHDLLAQAVSSPAPTVGSPSLSETSQDHSLTAQSVSTGAPTLGSPALGQVHDFAAADTDVPAPLVDGAVISQLHELASADVATSDPVIANASLDIDSHVLSAQDTTTAEPVIDSPTMASALSGQFFRAMSLSKESELTINITDKG